MGSRTRARAGGRVRAGAACLGIAGGIALAVVAALQQPAGAVPAAVEPLETPGAVGAVAYSLSTGADGRVRLIWIEPGTDGAPHLLKFARFDGSQWEPAREVARGHDWFVNWADHPSMTALPDGTLFAHWLVHTGRRAGAYGYGVRVVRSPDAGATWQRVFEDGMENVADYAGFLTFAAGPRGAEAVYLNPLAPDAGDRHGQEGSHVKTLVAVSMAPDGAVGVRQVVDADVCSCCPTDVAHTADGLVAVYRDHQAGEVRDISIVRQVGGRWTAPAPVHRDGWQIAGCPTNGPAVAAQGQLVAVAWFTAAGNLPRLKLAFSRDGGATFATPTVVDEGSPVGWPDLVLLDDGSAVVSWLERRGDGAGEVLLRRVVSGHVPGPAVGVARTVSGRSAGVPHLARAGDRLLVAWRRERVHTAAVPVAALRP